MILFEFRSYKVAPAVKRKQREHGKYITGTDLVSLPSLALFFAPKSILNGNLPREIKEAQMKLVNSRPKSNKRV